MDGRGGCCIARYATGAYDMSKMDKIMLRFRPIAPKPVTGSTNSGGSSSESSDAFSNGGRPKRKYVRDNNKNIKRCNRRRKSPPQQDDQVVTLPLLSETPDRKDSPARDPTGSAAKEVRNNESVSMWLSFDNCSPGKVDLPVPFWQADRTPARAAGSCVTVECVTETWAEGGGLGSTDEERRVKLSKDTCPGFISDGMGWVTWTNGSYRKMVGQEGKETETVTVWLVMKEKLVGMWYHRSFTCRVKVQYTCGKESGSLTLPCDVWRMDNGGFAWRLDVKAALSLGHGSVMIPYLT